MKGWTSVKLGNVCTIVGGGTPTRSRADYYGGPIPWVTPKDMKAWEIRGAELGITQLGLENSAARLIPPNTVLVVVRSGVLKHTLPIAISRLPVAINQDMKALLCSDRLHPDFLARFLKARSPIILQWVRGTTADNFSVDKLKALEVPLPPVSEQRWIAEILDKADALRTKRRDALAELDALTQSLFFYMFGDPVTNPKGWTKGTIGEVAERVTDGEHLTPRRATEGIKLLSARNIRDGYLDFANVDFIDPDEYQRISRRCDPSVGDVLISCSGSIGRVASVETAEKFSLVRSAALIRPNRGKIATKFLEHYLRTPAMKARMLRRANASSQANLFQGQIRELPVYLPPIRLQSEFADRCGTIARVRECERASCAELDALITSIQHRAFRGDL